MKIDELVRLIVGACEKELVDYMMTGAFAIGFYGIPRSTKDVDVVIGVQDGAMKRVIKRLEPEIDFSAQVEFDTLTWGRRQIGRPRARSLLVLELFEVFGDQFVSSQFDRRVSQFSTQIGRDTWLPTPEDVVVQKLRWGRNKDLDDARDVLAVQGPETLDMGYVRKWCGEHGTSERLDAALAGIPPLD